MTDSTQTSRRRGFIVGPSEGESLPGAGGRLVADTVRTDGRLSVIESVMPSGDQTPLHVHAEMDEAFYVLEGEYTITCGPDTFTATPGCFVYLPSGIPHALRAGRQGGRKLIFGQPAGLEDFFGELATAEDLVELGARHGITFL